jgi:catechol 2,3-dioxygenase-like lactoylglutathione lyase family enzyme
MCRTATIVIWGAMTALGGTTAAAEVVGACHVSPVVADLDRSARFYHGLLGLELSPTPGTDPPAWSDDRALLDLNGLPTRRVRHVAARIPSMPCGLELVQFEGRGRQPAPPRFQDPGTVELVFLVRDLDAIFGRLNAAGVPVVSRGGGPVTPSPTSGARGVVVRDPDGNLVELAQLAPLPVTTVPASSNVFDLRFRLTVPDLVEAVQYYRDHLGVAQEIPAFLAIPGVMDMFGLPPGGQFAATMTLLPGSTLMLEFMQLKDVGTGRTVSRNIQDPGAYRLQLAVSHFNSTVAGLRASGSRVISANGRPVSLGPDPAPRVITVRDPNGIFLVLKDAGGAR